MVKQKRKRLVRFFIKAFFIFIIVALGLTSSGLVKTRHGHHYNVALAAVNCSAVPTNTGVATISVQAVPVADTYKIWSRIQAPDATNNSYYLRIDGTTCYKVGDAAIPANQWVWVNYESGVTGTPITVTLSAGNHKFEFIGNEPNVKLDRVLLIPTSNNCDPSNPNGNGDRCVTVDQAPQVAIIPPNPTTLTGTVSISVTATDTDSTPVNKVELFANGASIGVVPPTQSGYILPWDTRTVPDGTYSLTAKATDTANLTTTSAPISITVQNGGGVDNPPTVTLTTLPNASNLTGTVTLTATATDDKGVTKVEFYDGTNLIGTDTTAVSNQYSVPWDTTTVGNGAHTVTAKAFDNKSPTPQTTTSSPVSVTITNPTGQPDLVVISVTANPANPATGSEVSFTATIKNQGTSPTPNGVIHGVGFYLDGAKTAANWSDNYTTSIAPGASVTLTANGGVVQGKATWTAAVGTHTLVANVDDVNRIAESNETNNTLSTSLVVTNPNPADNPPTATVTAPLSGTVQGTITLKAVATDDHGVSKVQFFANGSFLGQASPTGAANEYSLSWDTTIIPNGPVTITTKATDTANQVTTSAGVNLTINNTDTQPPTRPTNLNGTAPPSPTRIDLTWTASTDNVGVAKYLIQRNGVTIGQTAGNVTTFSDTTVSANTSYSYVVIAEDAARNDSLPSSAITVVTPQSSDTTPPTVPTNLQASLLTNQQVMLTWSPSTDNSGLVGYNIYRNGAKLSATLATDFGDATVTPGNSYVYTVSAFDAAGNMSVQSTPVTVNIVVALASQPVFRFFNRSNSEHFFTVDPQEKDYAISIGLAFENVGFRGFTTPAPNTLPVYRLVNSVNGQHLFTMDTNERDSAQTIGFKLEGVSFYEYPNQVSGSTPMYRLLNTINGEHFYTTDANERDAAARQNYVFEGISFYVPLN